MKIAMMRGLLGLAMGAFALTSMAAVTVTPPNLTGGLAGTLPGTVSVGTDGTSQYQVDLPMPPGTAGMVPRLGLHYGSGSSEGISGVGWGLTGLSEITRCQSTMLPDGQIRAVKGDAQDQYCLDGQRLVLVSGTLGGTAEFRTEVESFSRVKSYGTNAAIGPDTWTVETKAGLLQTYGGSSATLTDGSLDLAWSLARVADAHGNYASYEYETDASLEHFPTRIRYTGNDGAGLVPYDAVVFTYEARPGDSAVVSYEEDRKRTFANRLQSISTYVGTDSSGSGGTLARYWKIDYTSNTSSSSGRSLVSALHDCAGSTTNCLPTTNFTWTARTASDNILVGPNSGVWGGPTPTLAPEGQNDTVLQKLQRKVLPIDFNGDGKTDLLVSNGDGTWQLCASTGTSFSCTTQSNMPAVDSEHFVTGDFNGDGKTDVFITPTSASSSVGQVCLSNGTSFSCSTVTVPVTARSSLTNGWTALDLDGDGRDELVLIGGDGPTPIHSYICHLASGLSSPCTDAGAGGLIDDSGSSDIIQTRTQRLIADFDGDGRMDVLEFQNMAVDVSQPNLLNAVEWSISLGNGTGFIPVTNRLDKPAFRPTYGWNPIGDTNGDGRPDVTWTGPGVIKSSPTQGTQVLYHDSCHFMGVANVDCLQTTLANDDWRGTGVVMDDTYRMGLSVMYDASVGLYHRLSPTGAPEADFPTWSAGATQSCPNSAGAIQGDFDGDGHMDGACYDQTAQRWTVTIFGGGTAFPDLMSTVTDGNGLTSTFSYKNLSDSTAYSNGTGTTLPMKDVHGTTPVVSTLAMDAASGATIGATLNTNYAYAGQRTDVQRHAPLGFDTITATDVATGITTVTKYSQTFPTIGMPIQVTTSSPLRTLSTSSQVWASFTTNAGVLFPYLSSSAAQQWDLDGSVMPTTTAQTNNIDAWGNVTLATHTVTDTVNTETFVTTTTSQFQNNATTWQIGQLLDTVVTKTAPGAANVSRELAFTYDAFGLLASQTTQPTEPALKLAITYTRNPNLGVIIKQTQAWTDPLTSVAMSRDSVAVVYTDPAWRFPATIYNALNQATAYTYDMTTGQPLTVTDPNSQTTTWSYDGFGRKTRRGLPDGTSTTWAYKVCVDTCGIGQTAKSVTVTQSWANISGADQQANEPAEDFYDAHGRAVMSRTWDYAENAVYADQVYDAYGNLQKKSNPQTAADRSAGNYGWTTYNLYDNKRRPQRIDTTKRDNSGVDSTFITYAGLATTTQDANLHSTTRRLNGLGKIRQVTDALGHTTSYAYDPFGNLQTTTDPLGNVNTIQLDHLGHKTAQIDLDLGNWTYILDALGRVRQQTDAKQQVMTISYDPLDRATERLEADLDSRWTFDTALNGVGKLAESYTWIAATGTKDYRRVYAYDSLGRGSAVTTTLDWDYTQLHTYDAYGRLATVTHRRSAVGAANVATNPTGAGGGTVMVLIPIDDDLTIMIPAKVNVGTGQFGMPEIQYALGYNNQGDVSSVTRGATTLWTLNAQDARGRNQLETFGSGLMTATGYNAFTGRLEAIQTGTSNGSGSVNATIQGDAYGYDAVGNLISRNWLPATSAAAMTETFTYDPLNRLWTAQVGGLDVKNFAYDAIGDITAKANVGTYNYPAATTAQTHLLSFITGTVVGLTNPTFSYDANGNTQLGLNRAYAWSAANLPVSVDQLSDGTQASASLRHEFLYGPERQRTREIVRAMSGTSIGAVQRTIYSSGGIEKEIDAIAGTTKIRTYLPLGLGYTEEVFTGTTIASSSAGTPVERYFHKDHLGSLVIVTDASQAVLQRMAYDAWGRRRQSNGLEVGWQYLNAQTAANTLDHTGYTDQEQLDDLSLVHLNGRVYDPMTGRMTSPDPTIPNAFDLQSLNRASYVLNSPLGGVDPSGFNVITIVGNCGVQCVGGSISVDEFLRNAMKAAGATYQTATIRFPSVGSAIINKTKVYLIRAAGGTLIAAAEVAGPVTDTFLITFAIGTELNDATGQVASNATADLFAAMFPTDSEKKVAAMLGANSTNDESDEERTRGLPPEGVEPPVEGEVKPGPASRPSERDKGGQSLWDPTGGEWRYSPEDKWHNPHWDYNPHDKPSSPWQNVPIGPLPPRK